MDAPLKTDVLRVPYNIRIENNPMFRARDPDCLKAWHKVAKKSGLFRDPRCMMLLRAFIQEGDPYWRG